MSVIVAIKKDGVIYMGADSQASRGGTRMTLSNYNNYKISALCDVNNCIIGSVGGLRSNNIVKVADGLIPEAVDIKSAVDFRFVVKYFVPKLMEELEQYNALIRDKDDTLTMDAEFLLAYHDKLYSIDRVGCVIEIDDFYAIGSGDCEALGSLLSTRDIEDPIERIKRAIKASAVHDIYVDYPIVVSNTENVEFEIFYEQDL